MGFWVLPLQTHLRVEHTHVDLFCWGSGASIPGYKCLSGNEDGVSGPTMTPQSCGAEHYPGDCCEDLYKASFEDCICSLQPLLPRVMVLYFSFSVPFFFKFFWERLGRWAGGHAHWSETLVIKEQNVFINKNPLNHEKMGMCNLPNCLIILAYSLILSQFKYRFLNVLTLCSHCLTLLASVSLAQYRDNVFPYS